MIYTIRFHPEHTSKRGQLMPDGWRVYMGERPVTMLLPTLAAAERARGALLADDQRQRMTQQRKRAALRLLAP